MLPKDLGTMMLRILSKTLDFAQKERPDVKWANSLADRKFFVEVHTFIFFLTRRANVFVLELQIFFYSLISF